MATDWYDDKPPNNAGQYLKALRSVLENVEVTLKNGKTSTIDQAIEIIVKLILFTKRHNKKVMILGNGGSSAIADHLQNDLCKMAEVRAQTFYNTPLFSALANDEGGAKVFDSQVQLFADEGDLLVAISSSGRSPNILNAVQVAADALCPVITMSGFAPDNHLRLMGDVNLYVPSYTYGYVELAHQIFCHCLSDLTSYTVTGLISESTSDKEHGMAEEIQGEPQWQKLIF